MEDLATVAGDGAAMAILSRVGGVSEALVAGAQAVDSTDQRFQSMIKRSNLRINRNGRLMKMNKQKTKLRESKHQKVQKQKMTRKTRVTAAVHHHRRTTPKATKLERDVVAGVLHTWDYPFMEVMEDTGDGEGMA